MIEKLYLDNCMVYCIHIVRCYAPSAAKANFTGPILIHVLDLCTLDQHNEYLVFEKFDIITVQ